MMTVLLAVPYCWGGCAVGNLLMLSNAGFKLLLCWLNHIIK